MSYYYSSCDYDPLDYLLVMILLLRHYLDFVLMLFVGVPMDGQTEAATATEAPKPTMALYSVRPQVDSKLGPQCLNTCITTLTE